MAEESKTKDDTRRKPISPQLRKQLQTLFQKGNQCMTKGDHDYAEECFRVCVLKDPGNKLYAQAYVENLQKKYNNNKKGATGASLRTSGSRASLKKAQMQKKWIDVLKSGMEILKLNPWDSSALVAMATACMEMDCEDTELTYFEQALKKDVKDPEVNRKFGRALDRQGVRDPKLYERAMVCFQRVLENDKMDQEGRKMLANLQVKKTINRGGYDEAESTKDVRSDADGALAAMGVDAGSAKKLSREQQLEKDLKKDPTNLSKYRDLAEIHFTNEKYEEAAEVLRKGLEASGGADTGMRERLEDAEMEHRRKLMETAKMQAQREKTKENVANYQQLGKEYYLFRLDVFRKRTERDPGHLGYRYELAACLEKAQNYKEAIAAYQQAQGDVSRRGDVLLGLGRCFTKIKQYQLALNHFKQAVEALEKGEQDKLKDALYFSGVVAMDALQNEETAKEYLTRLASIDFAYKDVSERLDKLA